MFWRLAGWLNVAAHWFTTTIAPARVTRPDPDACPANDPAACLVAAVVPDPDAYPARDVTTGVPPRPDPDACPANDPAACLVAAVVPDPDAYPARTPAGDMLPLAEPVPDAVPDTGVVNPVAGRISRAHQAASLPVEAVHPSDTAPGVPVAAVCFPARNVAASEESM
jgi:hypothetical protein